jgi:hypothetical protein
MIRKCRQDLAEREAQQTGKRRCGPGQSICGAAAGREVAMTSARFAVAGSTSGSG